MPRIPPRRRYIYTDPSTGRQTMCWRGEAVYRCVKAVWGGVWAGGRLDKVTICAPVVAHWYRHVRLRPTR